VSVDVKDGAPERRSLREEHARLTRTRILEAARRLFVDRGYSTVSMQDIAREAGVAYQTVFSQFGGKLKLALDLCDSEFPHVANTVAMLSEAEQSGDAEACLRLLGTFARRLYEPCAEILRFMRESGDPELISRLREIESRRLQQLARLGPLLDRSGRLRRGVSGAAAVDLAWSLTSPATYEQLVVDRGWTPDQFESWLGPALADLILAGG
jgi:AcrR family transcriptional regulator